MSILVPPVRMGFQTYVFLLGFFSLKRTVCKTTLGAALKVLLIMICKAKELQLSLHSLHSSVPAVVTFGFLFDFF